MIFRPVLNVHFHHMPELASLTIVIWVLEMPTPNDIYDAFCLPLFDVFECLTDSVYL